MNLSDETIEQLAVCLAKDTLNTIEAYCLMGSKKSSIDGKKLADHKVKNEVVIVELSEISPNIAERYNYHIRAYAHVYGFEVDELHELYGVLL